MPGTTTPRRGIERKILTSILSYSIFPLAIVMLLGLYIAREGQGNSVEQTLLTAAQKTSSGLRIAALGQLSSIRNLAKVDRIVAALTPNAAGDSEYSAFEGRAGGSARVSGPVDRPGITERPALDHCALRRPWQDHHEYAPPAQGIQRSPGMAMDTGRSTVR